ncbi:predicted protein [Naegleria gruberi]|uniref:Predicted protein n=1 Tax=Naegleria gruberi TaxID=5762 RepID=D2V8Y9_NAEGR|nr:uncharacterized protein NAEGRDRAFT_65330 [Naegleria gruberi]EFC46884.1 predicted protein [Naegleria gruberi]|eukprot:XP_002679628.1 predicted protein [Naegleria gruberi strain NEG-M]
MNINEWADRKYVLEAVKQDGSALEDADSSFKKDREIVLEAVKQNGWALQYADSSFKKDREIVLEAVKRYGPALEYADSLLKKDREIILEAVKHYGLALQYADSSFKKDREIILEAVKQNGLALEFADSSFKKDREIILEAVKQNGSALEDADSSFKKDREIVLEAVKQNGWALQYADSSFKKDREIVLEAVKRYGPALEYADSLLKKDREIILEAVKQNGYALEYADSSFKKDREIVLEAVKQHGLALEYADSSFKKDREIILEAVKQNGLALQYADSSFKKDREFILEAVKQNGWALEYADSILKKDREIILEAVKQNGLALKYADSSFKKDREIILESVKQNEYALKYADSSFKKDREFILEAVKQDGYALKYADSSFLKDREFILEAVKQNGRALQYADSSLKKDREIILEAVKQNVRALQYADSSFKKDREFILEAVKQNGLALEYADSLLKKDREIILEAVKQNGLALEYADSSFKKDREIILETVKQNGLTLEYADSLLKKDREIVLEAVKQNVRALEYADSSFKKDREFILETVKQDGYALKYADSLLKKDREIVLEAVKQNVRALEYADSSFKKDREFIYLLFKLNKENARKFSPSISKTIEECLNIQKKLSSNIIEQYSKIFMDEKDLYYAIELTSLFNPTPKSTIFNFNPIYTPIFVEKLIIFQILKRMNHSELSNDIIALIDLQSTKANYYLFCFRLDKFLEDNPSQSTRMKDLKNIVEQVATNFETSFYTKQEINEIMIFANKWFENEKTFDNYKQIICKYNELRGDLSKVFKALNYFYNYFKYNYDFISVLGYGGEGVAFKVFHKSSKSLRALKLKYNPEESEESTKETINLLNRTDIEGKIKCFDCEIIQNHLYSVMELGEESLSNYISRNNQDGIYRNGFINKEKLIEILEIFIKVLNSVQSIHDHNILHRDLDPQNIVKVQDHYKIIDFETSRVIKTGNSITIARGKFAYMSPEVSHDNYSDDLLKSDDNEKLAHNVGQITISCDIFSLGCILLKLLTNCPLQLCERFVNDPDVSKYNDKYPYFSGHGKYFYTVVTTTEGEMKLHYAIEKLINETINADLGVNNILIRSIISMIQRDSSKRLNCYSHKLTIKNILKFLKGEIKDITFNIEKQVGELKKISPLRSYSQLVEENTNLLERIKVLEEENRKLKQN